MAWSGGRTNPVLWYPDHSSVFPDFGFVSGVFAGDAEHWSTAGGAPPTIVTGEGEAIGSVVRCNKTSGNQSYIQMSTLRTVPNLKTGSNGTLYYYLRLKCKAESGNTPLQVRLDYYTSGGAFISSASSFFVTMGSDLPADNTWRYFRGSAGTSVPATAAKIAGILGMTSASATTADTYIDYCYVGLALDFQALSPSNDGSWAKHPYKYKRQRASMIEQSTYGTHEGLQYNLGGSYEGEIETTPWEDSGRTTWNEFINYCSDGTPFTIFHDQTSFSRDYFAKAILLNEDDGLRQVPGRAEWNGRINWREVK